MKRIALLAAAALLTFGAATAQTPTQTTTPPSRMGDTPEERAARHSAQLTKDLGLNADQAAKVKQVLLEQEKTMPAPPRGGRPGQPPAGGPPVGEGQNEPMSAPRAAQDAKLKQILTADQYTKYTAQQADRMKHAGPGKGPAPDGTKVKAADEPAVKTIRKTKKTRTKKTPAA